MIRQELSGAIVEAPQERYQLNWPGKREALLTANAPIAKTLRPCREESVDFDSTQNLYIEGDNLDALKLLRDDGVIFISIDDNEQANLKRLCVMRFLGRITF